MKDIIEWLIGIEERAAKLYADSAAHLHDDNDLAGLLRQLAEDERLHVKLMQKALELYRDKSLIEPSMALDVITKTNIENCFLPCERKLKTRSLNRDDVHECLAESEFSEWNDIFLLVINTLKNNNIEFMAAVEEAHRHKTKIVSYMEALPDSQKYLDTINHLKEILLNNILIVDDSPLMRNFLEAIFSKRFGTIETAANGKEALEKINAKFFDVIISDIDMPLINGVQLIKEAQKRDPSINNRFLFLTGTTSEEVLRFFDDNKLKFLIKPATIKDIYQAVKEIVQGNGL